ncbi:MAG: MFS transporter [Acidobacteria bacterium]|nr:MFS transporter [Acidobacteriota bacterium]
MRANGITRNVFVLGLVSFFTDISSEMLYPIIPLFLTGTLRAPVPVIGLIEGAAEATASVLKALSGWWSDRSGARRSFVIAGYGLSALTRPMLALAGRWCSRRVWPIASARVCGARRGTP